MFIIRKTLNIKPSSLRRLISTATLPEPPTSAAYDELINTAGRNHDFSTVSHLLNQRYEKGFFTTNNTFKFISTDISILNDVLKTVSDLKEPHCRKTSYTSLISSLCKIQRVDDALSASTAALAGGKSNADAATFHPIISLLTRRKDFDGAWRVVELMKEKNVARDVTCYNYFLTAYSISKDLKSNVEVLKRMNEEGLKADARAYDALVLGACKVGKVDGGILILKKMLDDGVEAMYATYAHIIGSLVKLGRFSQGVKFVIDQGGKDKKLDLHNFGLLANRLIGAKKVDEAKYVVEEMVKRGLELEDNLQKIYDENVKSIFKPLKPIRGGIPICFPQFSNLGPLETHGFARSRLWTFDDDPPPFPPDAANKVFIDLILRPTKEDLKIWLHSFEYRLPITLGLGGDLMLTSRIRNTGTDGKPFTITFAYHTYFSASDISEVRVEGLETLDYLDNCKNRERYTEQGDSLTFESEVDKIYLGTPTKIAIMDHEKKRTFLIRKEGLPDAVVWNPWDKKAKAMADFGDDEYKHMLCVEAAVVEKPITLKPGEEWRGRQELSTVNKQLVS